MPWSRVAHTSKPCRRGDAWAPTRWHSERCIDYIVANDPRERVHVQFGELKISDHKMLFVEVDTAGLEVAQGYHIQSTSWYRKPDEVAVQEWEASIARHYPANAIELSGNTEEEWQEICARAASALWAAQSEHQEGDLPRGSRPKGCIPKAARVSQWGRGRRRNPVGTSMRWMGRLLEARRQRRLQHPDHELEAAVERDKPAGLPEGLEDEVLHEAERRLFVWRREGRTEALRNWRRKLQQDSRYLGQWLRQSFVSVPSAVRQHTQGGGQLGRLSKSVAESISFISEYWRTVWDRDVATAVAAATDMLQQEHIEEESWDVTVEELQAALSTKQGSSAGPDGWRQEELRHLPRAHWEDFLRLLHAWRRQGQFPADWQHSRMVILPKEAPDAMGAIPAAKTRPICVLHMHYRRGKEPVLGSKESQLRKRREAFVDVVHRRRRRPWRRQCTEAPRRSSSLWT